MRPPEREVADADAGRDDAPRELVAVIAQDARDGRVLMLGWADEEALTATRDTRLLHFHSRSRGRLWQKGETSGNVLRVRSLAWDCDRDAVLAQVEPSSSTCHTGARSCFDAGATEELVAGESGAQGFAWLETLWRTVAERASERPAGSYTTRLLDGGVDAVARKVAEEAVEVVMAAKDDATAAAAMVDRAPEARSALAGEVGDLLFHTLVLLAERGLEPRDVLDVLQRRAGGERRAAGPAG